LEEREEICRTIETLRSELEGLLVRGLSAAGPDDIRMISVVHEEFTRVGAAHLAGRLDALLAAIRASDRGAPTALLLAQTSLRVFERVLTLDTVAGMLAAADEAENGPSGAAQAASPPSPEDRKKLLPILDELAKAVEDLVATGLTTASEATRQKLDVSFKEASRHKVLRLAASLRYVNEELGRFLQDSASFSGKRLAFFLNRSWLIARGLSQAIRKNDTAVLNRLLMSSTPALVARVEVVPIAVAKRVAKGSSFSFDFRMRVINGDGPLKAGQPLVWSCLFPYDMRVPAEAHLHLPQPQKFNPKVLLDSNSVTVTDAAVSIDDHGRGRLLLGPKSTVTQGKPFKKWEPLWQWDMSGARARAARYTPSPLDLEVEMHEEVVLRDWEIGAPVEDTAAELKVYPITTKDGLTFSAVVSSGEEGKELTRALGELRKGKRPPLLGVMHYELCRLMLRPLAVLSDEGPRHLMLSNDPVNVRALMGTLKF
jgi:hypothetical protein